MKSFCGGCWTFLVIPNAGGDGKKLGADGVHVGQEDFSYADARTAMGPDRIVGVTCHNSRHLAMEAAEAGADYVAFGAFFPTQTKEAKARADIDTLRWWAKTMVVPCVDIGGITVENAKLLIEAGADFLAVSAGVWNECHVGALRHRHQDFGGTQDFVILDVFQAQLQRSDVPAFEGLLQAFYQRRSFATTF